MAIDSIAILAGTASSLLFAASVLPMLIKAARTRDLTSYSRGNLVLANVGNLVHAIYVFSLPPGPIWVLHSFYLVSTGMMLGWYLRYGLRRSTHGLRERLGGSPDAAPRTALLPSPPSN